MISDTREIRWETLDRREVLIVYAFAVLLAQVVNDHEIDPESIPFSPADEMAARQYYGSVQNTMLKPSHLHSHDFCFF